MRCSNGYSIRPYLYLIFPIKFRPRFINENVYRKIADDVGCRKGKFVAHDLILEHMNANFSKAAMAELGMLDGMEKETGWLRGLFRKHRKSFSYLQHLVVWEAFVPHLSVEQIFNLVESYPKVADEIKNEAVAAIDAPANTGVAEKQNKWKALVQKVGVKRLEITEAELYTHGYTVMIKDGLWS